jgi:DNA polymerase-3 subunit delta'
VVSVFADVIGHDRVIPLLERDADAPAQAYLFVGPGSVGKATVARRFAALVLCPDGAPECIRRVIAGVHPDLSIVEPEGRSALTVDQARSAAARAVLAPTEAARKVFLFEEAGMMNDEAANALLKTLEEPTDTTVFVLVCESEYDLPATVASRSRTVVFGRVTDEEVVAALRDRGVGADQAEHAAAASGGRPGLALMLATRPEVAEFRSAWLAVPGKLSERAGDAFRLSDELIGAADPLLGALA